MKSPIKIPMELLLQQESDFLLDDCLFSGVAFKTLENKELESYIIENGKIIGNHYIPTYFDCPADLPQIDITDYLLNDIHGAGGYYVMHKGKPFTGLAFDCSPDYGPCFSEYLFVNGVISCESESEYINHVGVLTSLQLETNIFKERLFYENYQWFSDERIKRIAIVQEESKQYFCNLSFVESGAVSWFAPGKSFSEEMTALLFYWPFKDMLREIVFAPETTLSGTEMNNELLRFFVRHGSLHQVKKLEFYKTSVTPELAHSLTTSLGLAVEYIPREDKKHSQPAPSLADRFLDLFRAKK